MFWIYDLNLRISSYIVWGGNTFCIYDFSPDPTKNLNIMHGKNVSEMKIINGIYFSTPSQKCPNNGTLLHSTLQYCKP